MPMMTDSMIEQWVLRELRLSSEIGSREVCVLSSDGVITLKGTVTEYGGKMAAARAAQTAPGVVRVVNEIKVKACIALIPWHPATLPLTVRGTPSLFAKV